jgi:hypothetical protein
MATLNQKTDEIAALEKLQKDKAEWEQKLENSKGKPALIVEKIKNKIVEIKKAIREGGTTQKEVTAKQLADSLLKSRKKFLEMSKKDFFGVIKQLAKKPEYQFLLQMNRVEIVDDINRKAKPVGWRFSGRKNYKTPTPSQVKAGRANGSVYYEARPNRSDVSQARQLKKGGNVNDELIYCIYVTNTKNPNDNSELVAKVKAQGDAFLIRSELQKAAQHTPLVYDIKKKKYEDGGAIDINDLDIPVHYTMFEDDVYEYEDGGEIDINDLDIPVHYTMFEDDVYEYEDGGSVGNKKVINIDGYDYYLEKIDSTHFYLSNNKDNRGSAHHIGQHNGEPYYDEVRSWLKGGKKMSNGGGVTDYSGEYFSIRDFVDSNKGMDKIIAKLYKLKVDEVDNNLDGELGYDTEVIRKVLRGQGYRVTYNDNTEYIVVKKVNYEYAKGGFIAYADWDYDNQLGTFNSMQKMKEFAMKNKGKYNEIIFEDQYGDNIVVTKDDTDKDLNFLFSKMAKGGGVGLTPLKHEEFVKLAQEKGYKNKEEAAQEMGYRYNGEMWVDKRNEPYKKPKFANGGSISDSPFSVEIFKSKLRLDNEMPNASKGDFTTFQKAKEYAIDMIDSGNYFAYINSKSGYLWGVSNKGVEQF